MTAAVLAAVLAAWRRGKKVVGAVGNYDMFSAQLRRLMKECRLETSCAGVMAVICFGLEVVDVAEEVAPGWKCSVAKSGRREGV